MISGPHNGIFLREYTTAYQDNKDLDRKHHVRRSDRHPCNRQGRGHKRDHRLCLGIQPCSRQHIVGSTQQVAHSRQCIVGSIVGTTQQVLHSRQYIVGSTQQVVHSRYYIVGSTQQVLHSRYYIVGTTQQVLHSRWYIVGGTQQVLHSRYYIVGGTQYEVHSRQTTQMLLQTNSVLRMNYNLHF